MTCLPLEFTHLDHLVDGWVLTDSRARSAKRLSTDFDEIQTFYQEMLDAAPAILDYLRERRLGELDEKDENLLKLMLSLAEIGPCVEWYGQASVKDGFPASRFPLVTQLPDTLPQA